MGNIKLGTVMDSAIYQLNRLVFIGITVFLSMSEYSQGFSP